MDTIRFGHRNLDVACELQPAEAGARVEEWRRLCGAGLGSEPIPGGARLWLPFEAREAVEDLARREAGCCGFLDLELATESDRLRLDITSRVQHAEPVIACLVGIEPGCALECC